MNVKLNMEVSISVGFLKQCVPYLERIPMPNILYESDGDSHILVEYQQIYKQ